MGEARKIVQRRILLVQQPSGRAELLVFCPFKRTQVELDCCVSCEFYRGLSQQPCQLCCRFPDAMFGPVDAGEARSC